MLEPERIRTSIHGTVVQATTIKVQFRWLFVTSPNNNNRFGGVTMLQDNNKTKVIEICINLNDQSKRKQLPTFNLNQTSTIKLWK
jgi:hypothetical protein